MNPDITVLMPIYNPDSDQLLAAVGSILNQSYSNFKLFIVDDCSKKSYEKLILEKYQDKRIVYSFLDKNRGLIGALNFGLENIDTEFIARMDQDDIAVVNRLEIQRDFLLKKLDYSIVFGFIDLMDGAGNYISTWGDDRECVEDSQIKQRLKKRNCLAHPTAFGRAEVYKKLKYSENQKLAEDYGLWLKYSSQGYKIGKIDKVLLHYRVQSSSITGASKNIFDVFRCPNIQFKHFLNLRRWPNPFDLSLFFNMLWNYIGASKLLLTRSMRS